MSTPYKRDIKAIVIHHPGDGKPPSVSILNRWNPYRYDYPEYDYGVESDGTIRTGRPLNIQGSHCIATKPPYSQRGDQWWNQNSIGIAVAGDFTKFPMSAAQFNGLVSLVKHLMAQYGLTLDNVYPHCQVANTACPGCTYSKVASLHGMWSYDEFEKAVLKNDIAVVKGVTEVLDVAVLLFTDNDYWAGIDVSHANGSCAIFVRGTDKTVIHPDAKAAKKLIVVGGASTGHPSEMLLSGNTKYDTAAAVAKYLG